MHRAIILGLTSAHRNMERILTLMRLQADTMQPGADGSALMLLQNAIGYMHNFPGVIHHPTEEVIFSRLIYRAPDSSELCQRLLQQHQLFGDLESAMLRHVRHARQGDLLAHRQVKDSVALYCREHYSHIHTEDTDFVPQAIKWLAVEDWQQVNSEARSDLDPIFEGSALKTYDNLYDCLMAANQYLILH
ncbi:MAG TPA: hemerythrin domain-containing protein [Gammaproteobacteria bacterium]|nr:hemerythrin domain-containing protein [Gammaproteobacteria bacterium]